MTSLPGASTHMFSQAPGARAVAGTAHTRHRSRGVNTYVLSGSRGQGGCRNRSHSTSLPGRQHICSLRLPGPGRLPEPLTLHIAPGASTHMFSQAPGARAVAVTAHTRHRSPGRQHICSLRLPGPGRLPEPLTLDIAPRGVNTYVLSGSRGQGGCRNRSHSTSLPGASTHMLSQAPGARAVAGTAHTRHRSRGVNTYVLSGPRSQGGCRNRSHSTSLPGRQPICSLRLPGPGRLP